MNSFLLIIILLLMTSGNCLASTIKNKELRYGIIILGNMLLFVFIIILVEDISEKRTYEKELKYGNPYKINIIYEKQDTLYIPIDTTFILK